jgi:hypothetical protein
MRIPNLYAAAQDVVLSAVRRTAQRAANPLRLDDPCRLLNMSFRERPFHALW